MKKHLLAAFAAGLAWMAASTTLEAADTRALASGPFEKAIELRVTLGTSLDELVVTPASLTLEEDQTYKLVINNPSPSTHYFWAPELGGNAAWTLKVSVDRGNVELRETGAPGKEYLTWEFEIQPGGTAEWTFVPDVPGVYKWGCSNPEHAQSLMFGELRITPG